MGLPPSETEAVQDTVAEALPAVALTAVGADGAVATGTGALGVTLLDAAEAGLVPIALVAVTANVYAVPLVSPLTTTLVAGAVTVTFASVGSDAVTV